MYDMLRNRFAVAMANAKALKARRDAGEALEDFDIRWELYALTKKMPNARLADTRGMYAWIRPLKGEVSADLAAGTGFLTRSLEEWTESRVWAVDPSRGQLDVCAQECGSNVVTVHGVPDDSAVLEVIKPGSCDFVTSFGGIHHVKDQAAMFHNVAAMLKPGGRFVAADVGLGTTLQTHFDEEVAQYCLTGHTATWLSPLRITQLAADAGLWVRRQGVRKLQWEFADETEMALFFVGLHAYDLPDVTIVASLNKALGTEWRNGKLYLNWPMLFFDIRRPM